MLSPAAVASDAIELVVLVDFISRLPFLPNLPKRQKQTSRRRNKHDRRMSENKTQDKAPTPPAFRFGAGDAVWWSHGRHVPKQAAIVRNATVRVDVQTLQRAMHWLVQLPRDVPESKIQLQPASDAEIDSTSADSIRARHRDTGQEIELPVRSTASIDVGHPFQETMCRMRPGSLPQIGDTFTLDLGHFAFHVLGGPAQDLDVSDGWHWLVVPNSVPAQVTNVWLTYVIETCDPEPAVHRLIADRHLQPRSESMCCTIL